MLRHEEVHVKQYHSVDKIILIIAKAVLWFNPIVYLYDKALEQMHEYEADEVTSRNFGTALYANLLLRLAVVKSDMPLVHNLVKSPIKKRIKMLFNSKSKNMKKLMYLLALPIGMGLLWGFTVKVVEVSSKIKNDDKPFTLVLDAGHGGKDAGAKVDGYSEKEIALSMANKIKIFAEAKGIKVVTTRDGDKNVSLKDRAKMEGNILISLHVNSEPLANGGKRNGIEMFTAPYDGDSKAAKANSVTRYVFTGIKHIEGIHIKDENQVKSLALLRDSKMPSVVLELGYLTNKNDLKFITNEIKQNELAAGIVNGILLYKEKGSNEEELSDKKVSTLFSLSNKQNDQIIRRKTIIEKSGAKGEETEVFINDKRINAIYSTKVGVVKIFFYVNGKTYNETEISKFTTDFIGKLSDKHGAGNTESSYKIDGIETNMNNYVIWFGIEPPLTDYMARNRSYFQKYNGKTVDGQIVGLTYSPTTKVMDGFFVKTTNGETLKANVEAKFAKQTQAMIGKNDQVSIKIYNVNYWKNTAYPVLTSYKISKGGKLLYDRWPKAATHTKATNEESLNIVQNKRAKMLPKPILLSSTSLRVDSKNEISYVKKGRMEIYGGILLANELTFDQKNKKVIAQKATFTDKAGKVITGDAFTFDYENGTYYVRAASDNISPVDKKAVLIDLDPIQYTATDSIKRNKLTGDLFLYGNVKLLNNNQTYQSDRMVYNKEKQNLKMRGNVQTYDRVSKTYILADSLDQNLKTGKGIFYGKVLRKYDR